MATIAKLNVLLSASMQGFTSVMNSAGNSVASLASEAEGAAMKIAKLAGIDPGHLKDLVKEQSDAIIATTRLANRLGFTTEELSRLQYAAKIATGSSENLGAALNVMEKKISSAAGKSSGAETDLEGIADAIDEADGAALNFSAKDAFGQIGLDAQKLRQMRPAEAFAEIAEAVGRLDNAYDRNRVLGAIFAKQGASIGLLALKGKEGIAELSAEADHLGLSFSGVDASKVELAHESLMKLEAVETGIGRALAIDLAPYIETVADMWLDFRAKGGSAGDKVGAAVEFVAESVAKTSDVVSLLEAGFDFFKSGALVATAGVVNAVDFLGGSLSKITNWLGLTDGEWTSTFSDMTNSLVEDANKAAEAADEALGAFSRGDRSKQVGQFFDDLRAKADANAQAMAKHADEMNRNTAGVRTFADGLDAADGNAKKVASSLEELQKQVNQAGLTDSQKKIDDLKNIGASPEDLAKAESLLKTIEKQNFTEKLGDKAKDLVDSLKTPLDIYNEKLAELQDMLDEGLLKQSDFDQLKGKIAADAAGPKQSLDFIAAGSAAADRFQFEQSAGIQSLNSNEIPKKQLSELESATTYLSQIGRDIGDIARRGDDESNVVIDDF